MRLRSLVAAALAPSVAVVWSCATDPIAEPRAEVDPNVPALDASWDPAPAAPARPGPEAPPSRRAPPDERDAEAEPEAPAPAPPSIPARRAASGELALTEIMYDPLGPEPAGEWVEVWNTARDARSLGGLTLRDGKGRTHTIAGDVRVPPGGHVVLARDREGAVAEGAPAEAIVYVYGAGLGADEGVLLANGASGAIAIEDGASVLARVDYGGFVLRAASGRSLQRVEGDGGAWCSAAPTPGAPAASAAADDCVTP